MSDSCFFLTALESSLTHAVDVRWVRETGSTNDDLKLWAHQRGFDKPVLLTADYQTAGRGTRGRVWRNVHQSLIFSLGLPFTAALRARAPGLLSIAAAMGAAGALSRAAMRKVFVKWPNDVWAEGGKAGGILLESVQDEEGRSSLIIGVGLNLEVESGGTTSSGWPIRAPAFLMNPRDPQFRGELLAMLVDDLLEVFKSLEDEDGVGRLFERWRLYDAFYGKEVLWRELDSGRTALGIDCGIDAEGRLIMQRSGAEGLHFLSGELVSLANS